MIRYNLTVTAWPPPQLFPIIRYNLTVTAWPPPQLFPMIRYNFTVTAWPPSQLFHMIRYNFTVTAWPPPQLFPMIRYRPSCHCQIISNHRKKLWWWPSCHCQIISNTVVSKLHVCWIFYLAIVTTSYDIMFKAMSVPVVIFSTDQSNNWISYLILDFNLKPWPSTLVHTKYKLNNWISSRALN
jgi:hypothetical protein